ncbi:hypothetical protein TD95_002465 [Thielaviopsis punctulata]|uniref:Sacsin/Nov domain-containing protein n=1 Tax=Thielaviopsis punctulata TaxID=72032 RepID=A0A0F4ZB22_9PEZI|nr:hypothetical protein TD95_002465 [Thielaviopsis punctulata]
MDYSRLRAAALQGAEDEEAVTVDTRALIDKVLARYSGEWTTLRELIQNAADAQATQVTIRFETHPSTTVALPSNPTRSDLLKHTITNHTLKRLVVQNDGVPFTKTDWGRLKRIAEGNPDETKIGAFGVGFYSVFADCEEPFVSSGAEAMAFYWKGNALFTKKSRLPEDQTTKYTTFVLDYRNTTTPLPNALSIAQFMATSLTFVALQKLEFYIDDYCLLSLHKKSSSPQPLTIPRDLNTRTKDGIMNVSAVDRTSTQIDARYMRAISWKPKTTALAKVSETFGGPITENQFIKSFFSRLTSSASTSASTQKEKAAAEEAAAAQKAAADDVTTLHQSTIFLRVTAAKIQTKVSASFSTELERATKKPPPKVAKLAILTSTYDDTKASESAAGAKDVADVFASVLPSKKPGGRIFIGFPTMQTTGAGLHISAPSVIPTVEREAIDLNARWVRTWNIEMLRAAGIITRLSFLDDMHTLDQAFRGSLPQKVRKLDEHVAQFMPEALHILKTYSFEDSTPNHQVAQIIDESFWTSFSRPTVDLFSSRGVLPSEKVRIPNAELSRFVDDIPVVPEPIKDSVFVRKLISFGLVSNITISDIQRALEAKALDKTQLSFFLKWMAQSVLTGRIDHQAKINLLDVAVATISDDETNPNGDGAIITLGSIKSFLSTNRIPPGMPLPPTTLPFAFTHSLNNTELDALGWEPLETLEWARFLIETSVKCADNVNVLKTPKFAVSALTVMSKNWENMPNSDRVILAELLKKHTVMPTKAGMRRPVESFFPNVKVFDDLPVIQGCSGLKEKFLVAIGVRKTVDLETIFTRLLKPDADGDKKWSHVELIRYLASVKDDIPKDDMRRLKDSRIVPAELPKSLSDGSFAGGGSTTALYKVSELFEPQDAIRELGFSVIQWPGTLRAGSPEAHFLVALGMRLVPAVPELVNLMAGRDAALRDRAMKYFISKFALHNYGAYDLTNAAQAFLPIEGDAKTLVAPKACFTNKAAAVMGFKILREDLHPYAMQFGVRLNPPFVECVKYVVQHPPRSSDQATTLFGYLSQRLNELREPFLSTLRQAAIVPVSKDRMMPPRDCYLGSSSQYSDIFDFVDFGTEANAFLFRCGAKEEPTRAELANFACDEPARLLSILQAEKYLSLLRSFADHVAELQNNRALWKKMRSAPFLLGWQQISSGKKAASDDDFDEEAPIKQYKLGSAADIVIPDDFILYRIFKTELICAPEEDVLESFYSALGCAKLRACVAEDLRIGHVLPKQDVSQMLRKHVVERAKIFLYEYTSDKKVAVRHDAKWLEKNLSVAVVQAVSLRRTLNRGRPITHTEKRSAASAQSGSGCVLYVAEGGKPDMYQIGQALCQILLHKQNQQAYIFFEPFLTLDLMGLKQRGYNVDRILRAKAAEARIAEAERQKALEEEQKRIKERDEAWRQQQQQQQQQQVAVTAEHPRGPQMPGGFGEEELMRESDNRQLQQQQQQQQVNNRKSRSFFSGLSRTLGFEKDSDSDNDDMSAGDSSSGAPKPRAAPPEKTTAVQPGPADDKGINPAALQQNLLNAVRSTRAHGSNELYAPPWKGHVADQTTYCDSNSGHDLTIAAESARGMKVYMARAVPADQVARLLATHNAAINAFAALLADVAGVYKLAPHVVHVFYDMAGPTIAFNLDGSVFCNLRYFLSLHWGDVQAAMSSSSSSLSSSSSSSSPLRVTEALAKKNEVVFWWWVVLAHELSHNLVKQHGASHTYYTQAFIQEYHGALMAKLASQTQARAQVQAQTRGFAAAGMSLPAPPGYTPPGKESLLD